MAYTIYNLTSDQAEFNCAGYSFKRVANYESAVKCLFQRAVATRCFVTGPGGLLIPQWVETQPQRPGAMTPTYQAQWEGPGVEPKAVIHRDTPRILDVLLLWSLWGGEYVCTGDRALYETTTFYGEILFEKKEELRVAVDRVIVSLQTDTIESIGLFPAVFLLLESYRTEIAEYQTLYVSPALDSLASKEKVAELGKEEAERLTTIKAELAAILETKRPKDPATDALWRNVLEPFLGAINGIGRPAAADKLLAFLTRSPALKPLALSSAVLESHARAFNKFRNATLHYAGLPDKVELSFGSGRKVTVKKSADRQQLLRALVYYTQTFKELLVLHFSRHLGVNSPWGEERAEKTLRQFFVDSLYNGHDWVAGAFMDNVVNGKS